jgi:hypothetical protein
LAAGWGAFHRFSPVGGAANGIPRNTRTDAVCVDVPDTCPVSILTGPSMAASAAAGSTSAAPSMNVRTLPVIVFPLRKSPVIAGC